MDLLLRIITLKTTDMKVFMNLAEAPSSVITRKEGTMLRLFFDFAEVPPSTEGTDGSTTTPATTDKQYSCTNVDIEGDRSYNSIVAAIVSANYTSDDVQAILANYTMAIDSTNTTLTDDKKAEYKAEYEAFQNVRTHAKAIADVVSQMG